MNLEKLNPWNWFKHEDSEPYQSEQIPVARKEMLPESKGSQVESLFQLQREMNRLFGDLFNTHGFPYLKSSLPNLHLQRDSIDRGVAGYFLQPQLDISGDQEQYEIILNIPGLTADDISVDIEGDRLLIRGAKEEKTESKDKHYYRVERHAGAFQRTLALPDDANADHITASLKDGVLTVSIPRRETADKNSRRIAINA